MICHQKTSNKKAGEFVCGYEAENSLDCGAVWNERVALRFRDDLPEHIHPRSDEVYEYITKYDRYHDYHSYIASNEWRIKANYAKRLASYRCEECGNHGGAGELHAHHKHYKNLYHEHLCDIEVLCANCHAKRHGK